MQRLALTVLFAAAAIAVSCAQEQGVGLRVINNSGEPFVVQRPGGEQITIHAGRSADLDCVSTPCAALTVRSPICTYGYDLAPFHQADPQLASRLAPVQTEMDFTLYLLPPGARRVARNLPEAPQSRLRPNSVDC
jgi:hypothetical protein